MLGIVVASVLVKHRQHLSHLVRPVVVFKVVNALPFAIDVRISMVHFIALSYKHRTAISTMQRFHPRAM